MDPVARSAAQRAAKQARNTGRLTSAGPEERQGSVVDQAGTLDTESNEPIASPVRLQGVRLVVVSCFIFFESSL